MDPVVWLREFLGSQDREPAVGRPDGRPLYAYLCTDEELASLQSLLASRLAGRFPDDPATAACFCLFGAEWWRRSYDGGPWAWVRITDALGVSKQPWGDLTHGVTRGLSYWGRRVGRVGDSQAYLSTLACEGGLPLELLRREGAHLRAYFRDLIETYLDVQRTVPAAELAGRLEARLPRAFRQPGVFELCGKLVEAVTELQPLTDGAADPLGTLDQRRPDWRSWLPLRISDGAAESLLRGLIKDTTEVVSGRRGSLRAIVSLARIPGGFSLGRSLALPGGIRSFQLAQLFGVETERLGNRVDLLLHLEGGPRRVAMLNRTPGTDDLYLVEAIDALERLRDEDLERPMQLSALSRGESLGPVTVPGGEPLSSLPWVFRREAVEPGEAEWWRLQAQGSGSTARDELVAAIPEDAELLLDPGANTEPLGAHRGRRLVLVRGTAVVRGPDYRCVLRTGAEGEGDAGWSWHGPSLAAVRGERVYLGLPVAYPLDGGSRIQRHDLRWRHVSGPRHWRSGTTPCVGWVEVEYLRGDDTVFRSRLAVAPEGARVRFEVGGDGGTIWLEGFSDALPHLRDEVAYSLTREPGCLRLDFPAPAEPTAELGIELRWPDSTLPLRLPFPAMGGRFVAPDGRVLAEDDPLSVDRLAGFRAEVFSHRSGAHRLFAKLRTRGFQDTVPEFELPLSSEGDGLDLGLIRSNVLRCLAASNALDAKVELMITESGRRLSRIFVRRYDLDVTRDLETGEVLFGDDPPAEAGRLQFEARPLWDPKARAEMLAPSGSGRWRFDPSSRTPGPWLILGWDGGWCRTRPLLWTVDGEPPAVEDELERMVRMPPASRGDGLDRLVRRLGQDLTAGEWERLTGYLETLGWLPANTFDVVRSVASARQTAVVALLRAGRSDRNVWDGLEALPFAWFLVPARVWASATQQLRSFFRSVMGADLGERQFVETFDRLNALVAERMPGMRTLTSWLESKVLRIRERVGAEGGYLPLAWPGSPLRPVLDQHLEEALDEARRRHEYFPTTGGTIDRAAALVPALLQPLLPDLRQDPAFCHDLLRAPVVAALLAAGGVRGTAEFACDLKRLRDFDPVWFDAAYEMCLASALALLAERDPDRLV